MRTREAWLRSACLGCLGLVGACGAEPEPAPESEDELVELPVQPPRDVHALHERGEWALEGPSERLRFLVGDLRRDPLAARLAQSVRLPNGNLLASVTNVLEEGFDYLTLFLELAPSAGSWTPVGVGLHRDTDFGFFWLDGLRGRVVVDATTPGVLDCRAELEATVGLRSDPFRENFTVDPAGDSVPLRSSLAGFRGNPLVR